MCCLAKDAIDGVIKHFVSGPGSTEDVRKLCATSANEDGSEPINFLNDLLRERRDVEVPEGDPDGHYAKRQSWIKACFNTYFDYIKGCMELPMLRQIERFAPIIGAAIAAGVAWEYLPKWSLSLSSNGEDISNVFGPVFDLATFSAGSLFAIYVLALSRANGFLGRIFNTKTFSLFHGYVAHAITVSVLLSLWTAAYMVVGIGDLSSNTVLLGAALWAGATAWVIIGVGRVVLIFLMMVGDRSGHHMGKPIGQTS